MPNASIAQEFFTEFRQTEFTLLENLFSCPLPSEIPVIWLHGSPSSGKSALIRAIVTATAHFSPIYFFDCTFYTDERSFFEDLACFLGIPHTLTRTNFASALLSQAKDKIECFWMCLDHVDSGGIPADLIEFIVKASELAGQKISFVFAARKSTVDLDCFPLLLPEFERATVEQLVKRHLSRLFPIAGIGNAISLMVDYFYPFYPQVKELVAIGERLFPEVSADSAECKEISHSTTKAYKLLMPRFKKVFDTFYAISKHSAGGAFKRFPLVGRHVLLSAFLASHNSLKRDIRLFSQKQSTGRSGRKPKNHALSEAIFCRSIQAAKPFEVRRLIAVFKNLFQSEHKVTVSEVEIQQEIARFCKLNLLSFVGVGSSAGLTKVKCRCNLTFADAESLVPSFDLKRYLFE